MDLRGNCGGHISELLLAKLAQRPLAFDVPRRGAPSPYPSHAAGFVVTLVDRDTGSDAELRRARVPRRGARADRRDENMGGGVVDRRGREHVAGGRRVRLVPVAERGGVRGGALSGTRLRGPGNAVENRGVEPDVVVTASPSEHRAGEDPQLDAATREALALLRQRRADISSKEKEKEDDNEDEKTPADVARRDAALAAAARRERSGTGSVFEKTFPVRAAAAAESRNSLNPEGNPRCACLRGLSGCSRRTPEAFDSESDVRSDESDESESDDDRGRRGKPKGASRRR